VVSKAVLRWFRKNRDAEQESRETSKNRPSASQPQGGALGKHGLTEWFLTTFTAEEQAYMEERWKPFGGPANQTLSSGAEGEKASPEAAQFFLVLLADWFSTKKDSSIGQRILEKASTYEVDPVALHFQLVAYIKLRYKQRDDDPKAIDDVIRACEKMISIIPDVVEGMVNEHKANQDAIGKYDPDYEPTPFWGLPPKHAGFERLIIIRKKQGDKEAAERLQQRYENEWKTLVEALSPDKT